MISTPELSLVFPVFDEEDNIAAVLRQALQLAPRLANSFEIVVVDDGSRDRSVEIVEAWREREPCIRLLRHAANQGYGAALRAGLRGARGELVFFSDADLQFDLDELAQLLALAHSFDIVAGYRMPRRDPWGRRLLAFGWGTLVNQIFDLGVRDIDCAFKLFRRPVLEGIPIASVGACVNTEILVRARQAGFRIHQIPVSHTRRRRGRQSGARPDVILRALLEVAALYWDLRRPMRAPALPDEG